MEKQIVVCVAPKLFLPFFPLLCFLGKANCFQPSRDSTSCFCSSICAWPKSVDTEAAPVWHHVIPYGTGERFRRTDLAYLLLKLSYNSDVSQSNLLLWL